MCRYAQKWAGSYGLLSTTSKGKSNCGVTNSTRDGGLKSSSRDSGVRLSSLWCTTSKHFDLLHKAVGFGKLYIYKKRKLDTALCYDSDVGKVWRETGTNALFKAHWQHIFIKGVRGALQKSHFESRWVDGFLDGRTVILSTSQTLQQPIIL